MMILVMMTITMMTMMMIMTLFNNIVNSLSYGLSNNGFKFGVPFLEAKQICI